MFIKNFYVTEIDCSKYNIKYNETITVTVRLLDFNNNPVVGESITINSSRSLGTLSNTTGVTDSNGEFTVQYTGINWGIDTLKCNGASVGVRIIGGRKSHTYTPSRSGLTVNIIESSDMIGIGLNGTVSGSSSPLGYGSIPSSIAPSNNIVIPSQGAYGQLIIRASGSLETLIENNSSNGIVQGFWYAK